jgi:hypothetical protein
MEERVARVLRDGDIVSSALEGGDHGDGIFLVRESHDLDHGGGRGGGLLGGRGSDGVVVDVALRDLDYGSGGDLDDRD